MTDNDYIVYNLPEDKEPAKKAEKKNNAPKSVNKNPKKVNALTQILNGDFLTKEFFLNNLSFLFFLMFLLILLIAKGYYGKEVGKDIVKAQRDLDQSAAEYVELKSKLETETRRISLVEKLDSTGLKETKNATKVIRIKP
ncbi:MAG: FtsL-like putative cell division protein [Crocinitomicaceae bacterium]